MTKEQLIHKLHKLQDDSDIRFLCPDGYEANVDEIDYVQCSLNKAYWYIQLSEKRYIK